MKRPIKFLNPEEEIQKGAGKLPHWQQSNACYFITFRLADSIPSELMEKWKQDRDAWIRQNPQPWSEEKEEEYHRVFSMKIEKWLDQGRGECLLRDEGIRKIVLEKLIEKHGTSYSMHSLVIMPNHVHVLVSIHDVPLADLMHSWKGATAFLANKLLSRSGAFWQRDYFDRIVRDARHYERCKRYIANNPAKASLRNAGFTLWEGE